jgi:hypothetical protein
VQIGRPLRMGDPGLQKPAALHEAVLQQMQELIGAEPEGPGERLL